MDHLTEAEVLLYILLGILSWAFVYLGVMIKRDRARHRELMRARDESKAAKPIRRIFAEDWHGPQISFEEFERLWRDTAKCFRISPELLRPRDAVDDLIISTEFCWTTPGNDVADLVEDFVPEKDPFPIVGRGHETITDLLKDIIEYKDAADCTHHPSG